MLTFQGHRTWNRIFNVPQPDLEMFISPIFEDSNKQFICCSPGTVDAWSQLLGNTFPVISKHFQTHFNMSGQSHAALHHSATRKLLIVNRKQDHSLNRKQWSATLVKPSLMGNWQTLKKLFAIRINACQMHHILLKWATCKPVLLCQPSQRVDFTSEQCYDCRNCSILVICRGPHGIWDMPCENMQQARHYPSCLCLYRVPLRCVCYACRWK